ncbi:MULTISPECIES: NADH-quinone oxidoreductase subunit J [Planotetraspora]|uniref:NADH-quinone oxidoreductase subunit J n=2 Tax=Planotetraspora TaxID=58120 RepID=A0A8J3UIJ9_9ACTN|nr:MULTISPECIES: NADH-quinone oxidoreductase subunit J [Planotetraspora]GII30685.1 NADH:ubiquinone oxidoreductase subunit J [Planotetraspora mira]GII45602.1 NADH:ubiquinone oxidoreductase subunit J [Planotetraspora silvatica]
MGESITFWVLAVVSVIAALGLVFSRRAVYSALMLGVVMFSLAVLYAVQDAPFLAAVQIIVYTGAVMMLFLFVLMLVGVDSSDSLVETIRGQRFWAVLAGLAFAALLGLGIGNAVLSPPKGLAAANRAGNVPSLAELIFTRHVFAFEVTSALLITAALGAMVLAHRERAEPKQTQKDLSRARFVRFGQLGRNPGPLPGPGTYARHNAIDMPALLPDGSVSPLSVNRVVARYEAAEGTLPPEVERILQEEALSERANGHVARPLGEEDGK